MVSSLLRYRILEMESNLQECDIEEKSHLRAEGVLPQPSIENILYRVKVDPKTCHISYEFPKPINL